MAKHNKHLRWRFSSILLFSIFISQICFAQKDAKLDSLLNVLNKKIHDTSRIICLNAISEELLDASNYIESKKYAELALLLAESIHYRPGVASAYFGIGAAFYNLSNYSEAVKNYLNALKIFEEIKDKKGIANAYFILGAIYSDQGNYSEALKSQLTSLTIFEEIGNKQGIANSYNTIGTIYLRLGDSQKALQYQLSALKTSEEIGFKMGIANSAERVGNIYNEQGNDSEALKYYFSSLKVREEIGHKEGIASSYINIGIINYNQNNNDEALKYLRTAGKTYEAIGNLHGIAKIYQTIGIINYDEENHTEALQNCMSSLRVYEEIGQKKGIIDSYKLIGMIYQGQGNYSAAITNYQVALKLSKEIGDKAGICETLQNLGSLYIKLNLLDEAKKSLEEALSLAKEVGYVDLIMNIYISLADLDSLTGNHRQALEHFKLYTVFKDSLLNESNSKMIAEMKTKYETEKKDKEIQNLESEKLINNLELKVHQEALIRIKLEKQKILTENLFNRQQVNLLANEKRLQELEIEKNEVELAIQKVESDRKQDQVILLNKEGEIQKLEIKKQTLLRNYLLGGFFLFCILAFFTYNNYSTRQKLKLQTLRNKIASDLHDDVGSTLSSISIFSQIAQEQSKEVIPLLDTIGDSSRKMLDAMADIVWTINPENDQFEKIILRMRSFAYELLGAKNIDFEFIADEDISKIKLSMEVRKNLYLIFKEATNNMVKYAGADKAKFEIVNESNQLSLLIRDNGKGFDMNQSTEGNGIKNMKKRAMEIGAQLLIDTYPGSGTTIQLVMNV